MFLAKEMRSTLHGGKCIILQDSPSSFHVSVSHGNFTIGENLLSPSSLEELNNKIDELEIELLSKNMGEFSVKVNTQTLSLEESLTKVSNGWHVLVKEAYEIINSVNNPPVVLLVKEKFGGLRIYTAPYVEELEEKLITLQKKSFTVCETCGNLGSLRNKDRYITLCDDHADGADAIEPFDNGFLW